MSSLSFTAKVLKVSQPFTTANGSTIITVYLTNEKHQLPKQFHVYIAKGKKYTKAFNQLLLANEGDELKIIYEHWHKAKVSGLGGEIITITNITRPILNCEAEI